MTFYQYIAIATRIIDGDTVEADISLGFDITVRKSIRLHGINAPELTDKDPEIRQKANDAKDFLESILPIGTEFWVNSKKLDPYRRPIAEIFLPKSKTSINDQMLASGHAVVYK